jgi:hypothetical protein
MDYTFFRIVYLFSITLRHYFPALEAKMSEKVSVAPQNGDNVVMRSTGKQAAKTTKQAAKSVKSTTKKAAKTARKTVRCTF